MSSFDRSDNQYIYIYIVLLESVLGPARCGSSVAYYGRGLGSPPSLPSPQGRVPAAIVSRVRLGLPTMANLT